MSKYKQVYRDLKEKIDTRVYKRNTELPSENELVKEYGYSKDTIRKALSLLEINGYIQKIKGKNSVKIIVFIWSENIHYLFITLNDIKGF